MQLEVQFGSDTGMCLVNVRLETPVEMCLDHEQMGRRIDESLVEAGIDASEVVDLSICVRNSAGRWVPAKRNAEGKFIPYDWAS